MIAHERDPDVVRWGLHNLIDVCMLTTSGSCSSVTQYDTATSCADGYVSEYYNGTPNVNNVENDAVIAHVLQEEFSRIAAAESSGLNNPEQESIVAQDWLGPHGRCHGSEHENNKQVANDHSNADDCLKKEANDTCKEKDIDGDEIGIATSSSSTAEKSPTREELSHSLDIADESALDSELGKRLNEMVPIPHVPKINGEIPSKDEEISDHQRLLDRLKVYDLVENKVQGDGNCQFRSLSDQLYRSPEYHKFVRERVVDQLKAHPQIYEGYVPMAYGDYLKKMNKSGEWGDHVTLQAAADSYGVKIFVMTSFKDTCYIEILPQIQRSNRVIFLSFWAEVHYNSIYPEGELPFYEKKKKKWWELLS